MKMDYASSNETLKTTPFVEIITYPYIGKCAYSAIYQTSFRGSKLIKKFLVSRLDFSHSLSQIFQKYSNYSFFPSLFSLSEEIIAKKKNEKKKLYICFL